MTADERTAGQMRAKTGRVLEQGHAVMSPLRARSRQSGQPRTELDDSVSRELAVRRMGKEGRTRTGRDGRAQAAGSSVRLGRREDPGWWRDDVPRHAKAAFEGTPDASDVYGPYTTRRRPPPPLLGSPVRSLVQVCAHAAPPTLSTAAPTHSSAGSSSDTRPIHCSSAHGRPAPRPRLQPTSVALIRYLHTSQHHTPLCDRYPVPPATTLIPSPRPCREFFP